MPVKVIKPNHSGRRNMILHSFGEVTTSEPHKALLAFTKKRNGRNNQGMITVRHRGGGSARTCRILDFKQDKLEIPARVVSIEYDPYRSARIALVAYNDGEKRYNIAPDQLQVGETVMSSKSRIEVKAGNRMPLEMIPEGSFVHNVELEPGKGGVLARSAGCSVQLLAIEGRFAHLRTPSKEVRKVLRNCMATLGVVSNLDHHLTRVGKAGTSRHRGHRPAVRGKAMNPCDHPHGGGNGHCPIGLKFRKTLWGKPARGVHTRRTKKASTRMIFSRRTK
ncbi:MAG: LSU ribosomal protein L2P [Parcubacteria group bacterium Gr01-1014_18]|nr:MAG: LSU ribosomal protein L2P [Parcubacteria group bacterium Greene0416_36]TSC80255.1 MAG: LSU ribosomal protein L2P [Parcubacteria group bacterium Gr01-1014_18]TSC98234.1 MAG: LSU ribosomal protein L2P [Parcubacteria group bacterium Greene1014_20]TSD07023.1 MAG: LSU ribosomal protein L2P [Parcubacteria group bacterium Greene0714_2]